MTEMKLFVSHLLQVIQCTQIYEVLLGRALSHNDTQLTPTSDIRHIQNNAQQQSKVAYRLCRIALLRFF